MFAPLLSVLLLAAPAAKPIAPEKLRKIQQLQALTHADRQGEQVLAGLKAHTTSAQFARVQSLIKPEELNARLAALYDRHFTSDELDGLIAFYESTLGQKLVDALPQLTAESVQVAQQYAAEKLMAAQPTRDVPGK